MTLRRPDTAFSLSHGLKRPRVTDAGFLRYVHGLPCIVSGCGRPGEAAHVRYSSIPHGKRETGKGERPDDRWTVPLCPAHHREGPDAQHNRNERRWWIEHEIDPLVIAALLYSAYHARQDDGDAARMICMHAHEIACRLP